MANPRSPVDMTTAPAVPLTVEDMDHSVLSGVSDTSEERYTPYELFQTADGTQAQSAERIQFSIVSSQGSGVATSVLW